MAEDAIINGTGAGQPLGILNSNAVVQVSKEVGQVQNTLKAENVEKMYSRMFAPCVKNAVWLINQDVYPQIFQFHHAVKNTAAFISNDRVNSSLIQGKLSSKEYVNPELAREIIPWASAETLQELPLAA